ncbi:DUF6077 domain-containing protein [Catellatospora bangladeshensis]|uniref:DUF6077 domain-containing protein n=1 Tax=Catellatospora bangladeshensis TaxID=310355 RepID=UPI003607EEA0
MDRALPPRLLRLGPSVHPLLHVAGADRRRNGVQPAPPGRGSRRAGGRGRSGGRAAERDGRRLAPPAAAEGRPARGRGRGGAGRVPHLRLVLVAGHRAGPGRLRRHADRDRLLAPPGRAEHHHPAAGRAGAGGLAGHGGDRAGAQPQLAGRRLLRRQVGVDRRARPDPLRDFLFTDQVLPGLSSQPPISSFEAFAGAIGAATGLHASSATWFVLLPVLAIVASLALWRLAHRWAPRRPLLVFGIGLAYLLLVAGEDAALGTFHLRLAEGKGMFVSAMIPLAWVYLTDLVEHRTRRSLWLLVALSIASVGLSTVSVMLLPVMAGAAWVILLLMRRPRDAFASALALTVYPVAVTVAFRLWMGGMTEEMATLQFYDARGTLARTVLVGVIGLISAFALWAGALFVRDGVPRLLTAGAVTTLTVLLIPGVIETIHGFTGLGPVLWRLPWIVPFPVLIGMYVALPWERWLRLESRGGLAPRAIPVAVAAALVGALAFAGTPMWSSKSHVFVDRATALRIPVPAWKIPVGRKIAAFWIRDLDRPAGYLLAPSIVMRAMPMVTSRVPVVMARDGYLIEYGWESEFALDRRKLSAWADGNSDASAADLTAAMKRVGVGTVCVWDSNDKAIAMAPQLGLTELASRPDPNGMVCYTANPAA